MYGNPNPLLMLCVRNHSLCGSTVGVLVAAVCQFSEMLPMSRSLSVSKFYKSYGLIPNGSSAIILKVFLIKTLK